jgi:hypothetical protein
MKSQIAKKQQLRFEKHSMATAELHTVWLQEISWRSS